MGTQEWHDCPDVFRSTFLMTYASFVVYATKIGVERVGKPGSSEETRIGIKNHFAKYSFFVPETYDSIWRNLDAVMTATNADAPETQIGKLCAQARSDLERWPILSDGFKTQLVEFELRALVSIAEKAALSWSAQKQA